MSRPVGTPFWGESVPPEDWSVLSGSADYAFADGSFLVANAFVGGAARAWGEGNGLDGDDYIRVPSAAKLLWIFDSTWSYLQSGDSVTTYWMVRARGSGTIELTNDLDTTWDYTDPAGASIGMETVSGGAWTEYIFETTAYTLTNLLAPAGGFRVAVDVVGAVDIDVVQLRAWPPTGALGGFSSTFPSTNTELAVSSAGKFGVAGFGDDVHGGPDQDFLESWQSAVDELEAATPGSVAGGSPDVFGGELFSFVGDGLWTLRGSIRKYECDPSGLIPSPTGTQGVDYIRRPDRTYADAYEFIRFTSGFPAVVGWLNESISVARFEESPDVGNFQIRLTDVDTIAPADTLGATLLLEEESFDSSASGGFAVSTVFGIDLGTFDPFTVSAFSEWSQNANPPTGPYGGGAVLSQPSFFLGVSDFDTQYDPLTGQVQIPPYRVWSPDGAPEVSWVRHRQRGDGLGLSTLRWRGHSTVQASNRWRGIR